MIGIWRSKNAMRLAIEPSEPDPKRPRLTFPELLMLGLAHAIVHKIVHHGGPLFYFGGGGDVIKLDDTHFSHHACGHVVEVMAM